MELALRTSDVFTNMTNEELLFVDGGWKWSWGAACSVVGGALTLACGIVCCATGGGVAIGVLGICGGVAGIAGGVCTFAEV